MGPRPVAVLDANVLFPFQLRNLLLHLSVEGLYKPLWSDQILEEVRRALAREAGVSDEQWSHLRGQMEKHFPDAWGSGYDGAADGLVLPDEGDRHVIALALAYEAEAIVTSNLKHFGAVTLDPFGTAAVHPDHFCMDLAERDPAAVLRAADRHRVSLKSHPMRAEEYLDSIGEKAGLRRTSRFLLEAGFLSRAVQRPRARR
jgi:hypothetical protein